MSKREREETKAEEVEFDVAEFLATLGRDSSGEPQFLPELGEQIVGVVESMRHVAIKKGGEASGKVTIELSFELAGSEVTCIPKLSAKHPSMGVPKSTLYIGPGGRLVGRDVRQLNIQFSGVPVQSEVKGASGKSELKAPQR